MKLESSSFASESAIPARCAFGAPADPVTLSDNRSPHLAWSEVPEGTQSFAIVCTDLDAPTKPDDVNQEGRTVPYDLPRAEFHHWVLVDIAPDLRELEEGAYSTEVTPGGKEGPAAAGGTRTGPNNYTEWFAEDADMAGQYFGYDGPCPPWNDERVHRYVFRVFALDIAKAPVEGVFRTEDALAAIEGHVLAEASLMGTYNIYADAR